MAQRLTLMGSDVLPIRWVAMQIKNAIGKITKKIPGELSDEFKTLELANQDFQRVANLEEKQKRKSDAPVDTDALEDEVKVSEQVEKLDAKEASAQLKYNQEEQRLRDQVAFYERELGALQREMTYEQIKKVALDNKYNLDVAYRCDQVEDEINSKFNSCYRFFHCCDKELETLKAEFQKRRAALDGLLEKEEQLKAQLIAGLKVNIFKANQQLEQYLIKGPVKVTDDSGLRKQLRDDEAKIALAKTDFNNEIGQAAALSFLRVYECFSRISVKLKDYAQPDSAEDEKAPLVSAPSELDAVSKEFAAVERSLETRLDEFCCPAVSDLFLRQYYTNLFYLSPTRREDFLKGAEDSTTTKAIFSTEQPGVGKQAQLPGPTLSSARA